MESRRTTQQQNKKIQDAVTASIQNVFPIVSKGRRLEILNIDVKDTLSDTDFPNQKEVKLSRKTWENPVYADVQIVDDATNKVISRSKKVKIASLPKLTNRFTMIINGNEYQTINQIRRKPGIYSIMAQNGMLISEVHIKGKPFKIHLKPQTQRFIFKFKNREFRLWTLLNTLGVPDATIEDAWGRSLLDINKKGALNTEVSEMTAVYKLIYGKEPSNYKNVINGIKDFFKSTEIDPQVSKVTLGAEFSSVTPEALLKTSKKLIGIQKGEIKSDSRDSLIFKNIHSVDDLLIEHFDQNKAVLAKKIQRSLGIRDNIRDIIPSNTFSKPIKQFFTVGDLSSTAPQTNPVTIATDWQKTSPMGTGGIRNENQITFETRDIQPTHLGFLDPTATPEGPRVGVTVGLASEVTKKGNNILTPVIDKNGKRHNLNPIEFFEKKIGFPDQFKIVDGKPKPITKSIKAMYRGKTIQLTDKELDFYIRSPRSMFSYSTNLVPFLANTQGNRASTAARMITQALSLDNPEPPLVRVTRTAGDIGAPTYEGELGSYLNEWGIGSDGKKRTGVVTKISDDYIHIKDSEGKVDKFGLYRDFPLNQDGYLNVTSINVKPGDRVNDKTVLVDTNYTSNKGLLSLGKNLTTAYMSYKGLNWEDGTIISNSAAKKLSHTSIHKKNIFFSPKVTTFDLKKFRAWYPDALTTVNAEKLDERGLPKIGKTFLPGENVVAFLIEKEMDSNDEALRRLDKTSFRPYKKHITEWDEEEPGIVTDVRISGRNIDVYIKSIHPFKEGDKLCVDELTEILTKDGWKFLLDININDLFCTLDPKTHNIEYQEASQINIYDHNEKLYHIENTLIDQMVTFDHRMYIKQRHSDQYKLIKAKDIQNKRVRYLKNGHWKGMTGIVPDEFKNKMDDFEYAALLGWYLSEGNTNKGKKGYVTTIHQSKKVNFKKYNEIANLIQLCGFTPIYRPDRILFNGKAIHYYLTQFGHAHEKYVPGEIKKASSEIIKTFLDAYSKGDGHKTKTGQHVITTNSVRMRDDLMELWLKAGYSATYKLRVKKGDLVCGIIANHDIWDVRQIRTKNSPQVNHGHIHTQQGQIEEIISYQGKVGCPTTSNGVIYIRRNGKTSWTGNSNRYGGKGIVTKIIPNDEMPHRKDGTPIEVILNAHGVPGRMNIGQLLETAAGKVAAKEGKPYHIANFSNFGKDASKELLDYMKKKGISPNETLTDGKNGKEIETPIFVGNQNFIKLRHVINKKLGVHNIGQYDIDKAPVGKGAQSVGVLDTYAYLAHGANCFKNSTLIDTLEGPMTIGAIYEATKDIYVKSWNGEKIVFNKVINKFKRKAYLNELTNIKYRNYVETTTLGHEFYQPDMTKKEIGDTNLAVLENRDGISEKQKQIFIGSFLGDGYVHPGGHLQITHCEQQEEYLKYKACILESKVSDKTLRKNGYKPNSFYYKTIYPVTAFGKYVRYIGYNKNKKVVNKEILDLLDIEGLAILYGDDGTFYTNSKKSANTVRICTYDFTENENKLIANKIQKLTGAKFDVRSKDNKYWMLKCSRKKDLVKFFEAIASHIHYNIDYKLPDEFKNRFDKDDKNSIINSITPVAVKKFDYHFPPSASNSKFKWVYNIEVKDTHNYFLTSGFLVGNSNLREIAEIKGRQNEEYWRNLQFGLPSIPTKENFAFDKFLTYLKGMGVNTQKKGNRLRIFPLTDANTMMLSNGELPDPGAVLKGKNLIGRKGGLYDSTITGGELGTQYSHVNLAVRIPNPMYENAIQKVLGLTENKYVAIIDGKEELNGMTGVTAITNALKDVKVTPMLRSMEKELKIAPPSKVNRLNTTIKYLRTLKDLKMKPDQAYTMKKLLVIPPIFRPVYPLPSGDLMVSDLTKHYKDVGAINTRYKKARKNLSESDDVRASSHLYASVKALQGFTDPVVYGESKYKGFMKEMEHLKKGIIFGKNWSKRQDISARSTITVDPSLGVDEVGIPTAMANKMLKPFIISELKTSGIPASKALKEYENQTVMAKGALQEVLRKRPVILNRAPALHKHSVQALNAQLTDGKSIKMNPLIAKGYNFDLDGDTMAVHVPIGPAAVEEARHMLPSQILFKHGDGKLVPMLSHEYIYGLYLLSKIDKKTSKSFSSIEEAKESGIPWTHQFDLNGKKMTIGQYMINAELPEEFRDYELVLDAKTARRVLTRIGKEKPGFFKDVINSWKSLGNLKAYQQGNTLSITDMAIDRSYKHDLLKKKLPSIEKIKDEDKKIEAYQKLVDEIEKAQGTQIKKEKNNLLGMITSGSFGKVGNIRQVLSLPGLLTDIENKPIPMLFDKSYAEGLDTSSYFNHLTGVRKGTVDRSVNTQHSGNLNKVLLSVNRRLMITKEDCGTQRGKSVSIDDRDAIDRTSLITVAGIVKRNDVLTGEVILKLKKAKVKEIKVRSPLTCDAVEGICSLCYGLTPDGKLPDVGTNIGVLDSSAVTEASTQLVMNSFHSGGAVGSGGEVTQEFPRLKQLFFVPEKLAGKATLSSVKGTVKTLEKNETGGYNVRIEGYGKENDKDFVIGPGRTPTVSVGDKVEPGDRLSDGVIKPQELSAFKDHLSAQRYLVEEASAIYGPGFHKKTFETAIRGVSDNAEVIDAPNDSGFIRGDKTSISSLKSLNRKRRKEGLGEIKFIPYFKSIDTLNTDAEDFLTRLTSSRVKAGLTTGAAKGLYANIKGKDPIPAYIYGENFGKNTDYKKGNFF